MALTGVQKTLQLTLRARAQEHTRPNPLFRDPTAAEWSAQLMWDPGYAMLYDDKLQTSFAVRTRVYDDAVQRFLSEHSGALIVELGAGFSTRYSRLGPSGATWIEIDMPEVIAMRRVLEDEAPDHRFIAGSIFEFGWIDKLPPAPHEDTLFIAEGVMVFVEREEAKALIDALREHFPGATFLLDVGGGALETGTAQRFAQVGAPMSWFVKDESEVAALGVEIVSVWPTLAQYPERWGRKADEELSPEMRAVGLIIEAKILHPAYG